ncbi:MAG: nucleoside monophosphate kinase [Alphaproteobacteria bacterium]|nr:nucleoside monophosphate kinase [Alphaproteobacteria bacterium]MBN2779835.1 nucleoside monophosphate kinase [Alphaproteobacteria bacterium]
MKKIFIIFGPPGSGKGTHSARLACSYNIAHLSTGEMLRQKASDEERALMKKGILVSDNRLVELLRVRIQNSDCDNGFILDGFPRNLLQVELLDNLLKEQSLSLEAVIALEAPEDVLLSRLSGRRFCPNCSNNYHLTYDPPEQDGFCSCGFELRQRADDNSETIRARLRVFKEETIPLLDVYSLRSLPIIHVVSAGEINDVQKIIYERVQSTLLLSRFV